MIFFRRTYRTIALTMAFLMFFTSAGFAIDMHYCGGELKSVSIFGKAKTCHEMTKKDAVMKDCPHHKKIISEVEDCSEDKNCCSNKTVIIQSDQDQKIQSSDFVVSKELKQFVIAYVAVFFSDNSTLERQKSKYELYRPPLISRDISVLNQIFLL